MDGIAIAVCPPDECRSENLCDELARLHQLVVREGCNLSFRLPFPLQDALDYWKGLLQACWSGRKTLVTAKDGATIVGCLVLVPDWSPCSPQRAEIAKLMVHPAYRRRGIARALTEHLEQEALKQGRWNVIVRCVTGFLETTYSSWGYDKISLFPEWSLKHDGTCFSNIAWLHKDLRDTSSLNDANKALSTHSPADDSILPGKVTSDPWDIQYRQRSPRSIRTDLFKALGHLLVAASAVENVAGFAGPASEADVRGFWHYRTSNLEDGSLLMFTAEHKGILAGCALLRPSQGQLGELRAEVSLLVVHPSYPKSYVAGGLLGLLEQTAATAGRWYLHIETFHGSDTDMFLAQHTSWQPCGILPDGAYSSHDSELSGIQAWRRDLRVKKF